MAQNYTAVGINNRNSLVQFRKLTPYNEDITWKQPFDNTAVAPGTWNKIRIDLKHAGDREFVINDIRMRFRLNFQNPNRPNVGNVFAVRATDLIRELYVKFNDDVVFHCDKPQELTHLWLMNNHKLSGEKRRVRQSYLLNYGVIPRGQPPPFYYHVFDNCWYMQPDKAEYIDNLATGQLVRDWTQNATEFHDGLPRLIYSDANGTGTQPLTNPYVFQFDVSLNELVGPVFTRLHQRRLEYLQIEVLFNPWVSQQDCQQFLLFANDPVRSMTLPAYGTALTATTGASGTPAVHPYAGAVYDNMEVHMLRSTFLDGVDGFTLPDNKMLSFLMHRYSRREYTFDFSNATNTLDIQLKDWEIRTNITRLYWMIAPDQNIMKSANIPNTFQPFGEPCWPYLDLTGVEIRWKNDKVLDLDTFFRVHRHYVLAENKRYGLNNPYIDFQRLCPKPPGPRQMKNGELTYYTWYNFARPYPTDLGVSLWDEKYEFPVYFVDFNMNVLAGVPGAEIVQGIVNDTSDYVIRLKRVLPDRNYESNPPDFSHKTDGTLKLWVWIEYQTLVNLAAGSNQFNRASQTVTKQLNVQN